MGQFRALVTGRVQGVCYRAETVALGRQLGLAGYARNLSDGRVEVAARGDDAPLQQLLAFLQHGPTLARVDRVDTDWEDRTPLAEGFTIRYGA